LSYKVTKSNRKLIQHPAFQIAILLVVSLTIFFVNLGGWDLWDPDEPRYAQVAKEMIESKNWILPHLNTQVYPDKPPVFFWLIALASMVKGEVTSFSARFPSALAAVVGILLTYLLGRRLYSARAGFISALVLATTVEYFWLGHRANIDMTLTLFILAALLSFYQGYQKSQKRFYYLTYLLMGIATITKGPVGFILPSLTVSAYLILKKEVPTLKKVFLNFGIVFFLIAIFAWLIPAFMQGGKSYVDEILLNQILGRVHDSWSHKRPFYYYILRLPPLLLPWFIYFPSAVIYYFTRKKTIKEDYLFPVIWFTVIFVFFSLCSGKRELYLLPLFPAFALMVGFLWDTFFKHREERWITRLIFIPSYLLFGSLMLVCGAAPFIPTLISSEYSQAFHFYPLALTLGSCTVASLFLLLKRKVVLSFATIVFMMAGSYLYSVSYVFPYINQFKSAKPLSSRITSMLRTDDLLGSYQLKAFAFNFYTGINTITPLETTLELITFFLQPKHRTFVLMNRIDFEVLAPLLPFHLSQVDTAKVGDRELVLITDYEEMPEIEITEFNPQDPRMRNIKVVSQLLNAYITKNDRENIERLMAYTKDHVSKYARLIAIEFYDDLSLDKLKTMSKTSPDRWRVFQNYINKACCWLSLTKKADTFLGGHLAKSLKEKLG